MPAKESSKYRPHGRPILYIFVTEEIYIPSVLTPF